MCIWKIDVFTNEATSFNFELHQIRLLLIFSMKHHTNIKSIKSPLSAIL